MDHELGLLPLPEEEVESQLDQVEILASFGVGNQGSCRHSALDYAKGGGLLPLDGVSSIL